MKKDRIILNFAVEPDLYERIKDYRFDKRIDTISEALRTLIEKGLQEEKPKKPSKK